MIRKFNDLNPHQPFSFRESVPSPRLNAFLYDEGQNTEKRGWDSISERWDRPTSKRGWETIQSEMTPLFRAVSPKRALEVVRNLWRNPSFRRRYLGYFQERKRSREVMDNIPVQFDNADDAWMLDDIEYDENGIPAFLSQTPNEHKPEPLEQPLHKSLPAKRGWEFVGSFQGRQRLPPRFLKSRSIDKRGWESLPWKRSAVTSFQEPSNVSPKLGYMYQYMQDVNSNRRFIWPHVDTKTLVDDIDDDIKERIPFAGGQRNYFDKRGWEVFQWKRDRESSGFDFQTAEEEPVEERQAMYPLIRLKRDIVNPHIKEDNSLSSNGDDVVNQHAFKRGWEDLPWKRNDESTPHRGLLGIGSSNVKPGYIWRQSVEPTSNDFMSQNDGKSVTSTEVKSFDSSHLENSAPLAINLDEHLSQEKGQDKNELMSGPDGKKRGWESIKWRRRTMAKSRDFINNVIKLHPLHHNYQNSPHNTFKSHIENQ